MNPTRTVSLLALTGSLLAISAPNTSHAVGGVLDSVVIVEDFPAEFRWAQERQYWTQLITYTRQQLAETREMVDRLGKPPTTSSQLVGSVPKITEPVGKAVELYTAEHAIKSNANLFLFPKTSAPLYQPQKAVNESFSAFGKGVKREEARYKQYAQQEALFARYRTAATNEEEVEKHELEVQRQALEQLKRVNTHAEVSVLSAKLSASQSRQAAAHHKATQAKSDLDAFRGHLELEDTRKAEADREWTQAVVEQMQRKALAAYNSQ